MQDVPLTITHLFDRAERPRAVASRDGAVQPSRTRYSAAATKSARVCHSEALFTEMGDALFLLDPEAVVPVYANLCARLQEDDAAGYRAIGFDHFALPDDPLFHVCTLAYMSDMTLLGSSKVTHPDELTQNASLDHAMWFLRPFRTDDWLLYDQSSPSAGFGRALTGGKIFDRGGRLVAAVVQEGLIRTLRS